MKAVTAAGWQWCATEDAAAHLPLFTVWREGPDGGLVPSDPVRRAAEWHSRRAAYAVDFPQAQGWIVCAPDGTAAARCLLEFTPARLFVIDLMVAPAWQNRGLGTAMLRRWQEAAATALTPLQLHVAKDNTNALRLYQRLDFARKGELGGHWLLEWNSPAAPPSTFPAPTRISAAPASVTTGAGGLPSPIPPSGKA